ncbi:NADH-quinone oxidoreductase subunit L [Marinomonas fungiae]|uniref:Probable inorganic carbon transporter subunit DabB n=1 Tax=Marinomonas fungiae TaxID=1137284 RepID=A0A0K6INH5_9GAMM|nr:NADH-quinone oxidoreductase subunit L [Marinomonas fungiae]CUB04636.1 NADH-Ubiquinone/plastoquinone (complex I), various chains [Marinomonas fungiae]
MTFMTFLLPALFALTGILCGLPRLRDRAASIALLSARIAPFLLLAILTSWFFITPDPQAPFHGSLLSALMLILVVFMAWVLVQFSQNYMAGEQRVAQYYRWLMLTLSAVILTLSSNHLLGFWAGWVGISLGLHFLLTFYPDRPRAILAAHKKFILARLAELSLLVAFSLLYLDHGTWYLIELMAEMQGGLSTYEQIAAVLIAIAALMKCAQLPVHGWLMQVVEAPTPISALLHAGIINLGGYLVLTFYPLLHLSPVAIWLLLIVAGLTTLISALIMTTRISVKVRLAWSTSAQMGLMLLECALGLYELAVLHLMTHSVYKAHAFLNSSNAVHEFLLRNVAPDDTPNFLSWIAGVVYATAAVILSVWLWHYQGPVSPWLLMGIALTLLVAQWRSVPHPTSLARLAIITVALSALYGGLKTATGWLLQDHIAEHTSQALSAPDLWACALFIVLFGLAVCLRYYAHLPWVRRFSVNLFAGLYLDEWFTKITLKIWPVTLPAYSKAKHHGVALLFPNLSKGWKK